MTFANVTASLALFVALGAGSYAVGAVPGKNGRITACYEKRGGELRVIDTAKRKAKCTRREKKVVWNQKGRDGSRDTAAQVLAKLETVDGPGSALDADTLDGAQADGFLRSERILFGRAPASDDGTLLLSVPSLSMEVRTRDVAAGDDLFEVRIRNTNPPGGARLYVTSGAGIAFVAPGATSAFGALGGLDARVAENGSPGLATLNCFAKVINAGDDNVMECTAVTAGGS